MKIYSFLSFLISSFALNVNEDPQEKQVALYPRPSPLLPIPLRPIPLPKPIILPELDEEAYYSNNVYDELEEIEKIEV